MSTDFRTIRQPSSDPLLKYVTGMSKALGKKLTEDLVGQLESSEDIYSDSQDTESGIKFQTDLNHNHSFLFNKDYYPMGEDFETLELWLKGYNMGFTLKDFSGHDRGSQLNGEPLLVDGSPFDYGIYDGSQGVKSTALQFNRPTSNTENQESIQVPDSTALQVVGGTGFSIFMRFRVFDISRQGDVDRTLFQKIDDSTKENGYMLRITDTGRLIWSVKRSNVWYSKQTVTGVITINAVYGIFVNYANSGNVQHIYTWIDTTPTPTVTDQTLTSTSDPSFQDGTTIHDLYIFEKGQGSDGYVYGDFYDLKMYDDDVVSSTEVDRHAINKFTISNIPYGQVMVTNHWATGATISSESYTTTSYTSTSYS